MTTFENRAPPIRRVLGTIALEEAIQLPEFRHKTIDYAYNPSKWEELAEKIIDIHDIRLKKMNESGVEYMMLSWTSHGAQGYSDQKEAEKVARRANDYMSEQCKKNPKRFGGFASVSMHDPMQAAKELERAIKELGLLGVILNDFQEAENGTKMLWYDQPEYDVFWAKVQELDVPCYIHPRGPIKQVYDHLWKDRVALLSAPFQFATGVAAHVIGMAANGVFDRFPRLQIVIGHLGELAIGGLWRFDHWMWRGRFGRSSNSKGYQAKHLLRYYFTHNIHITTSGNFSTPTLIHCMTEIGADRIMYSIDYPYEDIEEATEWWEGATISPADKLKMGRQNAIKLFKLPLEMDAPTENDKPYFKGGGTGPVSDWQIETSSSEEGWTRPT